MKIIHNSIHSNLYNTLLAEQENVFFTRKNQKISNIRIREIHFRILES